MPARVVHFSDLETVLDEPERAGALAATVERLRDDRTLVVGTGDNTAPGALSLATEGRGALALFEVLAPDADTFGNHDFDFGPDRARELAAAAPQSYLCANAERDGERFAAEETTPHALLTAGDRRVGVVGVAHPKTAAMNYAAGDVRFTDPVPAVRDATTALRDRGADHVVVASHCGRTDERIARETDVDAVLGGHVHDVHRDRVAGTLVVRPGRAGRHVSLVTLGDRPTVEIHDADADGVTATRVAERLRDRHADHGLDEVVATASEPIARTERAATTAGSPIGNFLTDALRWRTGADVAISPPGAIRAGDPLDGPVTVADLVGLVPYADDVVTVTLSGDRLRAALVAVPFGYHDDDHPERYCCHVSGAHLVWDDAVGRLERASVDGAALSSDREYTVALADYLVKTDHVVETVDETDVVAEHGPATRAVVEYAREVGLTPPRERRVERPRLGD